MFVILYITYSLLIAALLISLLLLLHSLGFRVWVLFLGVRGLGL